MSLLNFGKFNPGQFFKSTQLFAPVSPTIHHHTDPAHPTHLQEDRLKVMCWNVAKNNNSDQWQRDYRAMIEHYQPHIVFLQEAILSPNMLEVPAWQDMSWSFAPNLINKLSNRFSGVLTAAKTSCVSSQALVTCHYEPITNTPKISLLAEYELFNHNEALLTINIHAINFVTLHKFKAQLATIEHRLRQHRGPIIFAGDFNTWNHSRRQVLDQMAAKLNLVATSFLPKEAQHLKRFLNSPPLDYIFYRGFSQVQRSAKVIHEFDSSDHPPLLVELVRATTPSNPAC